MTESAVQETAVAVPVKTPKKKATTPKAKGASKKVAAAHPPTAQMVNSAIKNLKERGGSSLQAIKKYIASTYKVDAEKIAPFIKKYLKSAADSGKLIRTKGKGASGSFKMPSADTKKTDKKPAKPKAAKKPKVTKAKKPKVVADKSATTSTATPKKPKATSKPKAAKSKPAAAKKSPSKVKKVTKAPAAKKPKSPKPKKAAPKKTAKKPAKK